MSSLHRLLMAIPLFVTSLPLCGQTPLRNSAPFVNLSGRVDVNTATGVDLTNRIGAIEALPKFTADGSVTSPSSSYSINGTTGAVRFGSLTSDIGPSTVKATGTNTVFSEASRWARKLDVRDFGATCNGQNNSDDAPAFQAALNAASVGTQLVFPTGCYINTTVVINKSVNMSGDGAGASLYVPNTTAFSITANDVTLENFYVYGNRSSSLSNMLVQTKNVNRIAVRNIRGELLNSFGDYQGGFFNSVRNIHLRNMVTDCVHLENSTGTSGGTEGTDFFINGLTYDTDGTWNGGSYVAPTKACLWVQDYNGLNMNEFNLAHGGQIATVWINPAYTRSGSHRISSGVVGANTDGDGIRVEPVNGTVSDRTDINATGIASQIYGVHLTGAGKIDGYNLSNSRIYNQSKHGYLYDNTYASAVTNSIRSVVFSANGTSATGTYDDIRITSVGSTQTFSLVGNIFNLAAAQTSNVLLHNIESSLATLSLCSNDFGFSTPSSTRTVSSGPANVGCDDFQAVTLAASGSVALSPQSGELLLSDATSTNNTCLYLLGGNSVVLLGQSTGTTCVTGTAPTSAQLSVGYSNGYQIYNGSGTARTINYRIIRTRYSN